MTVREDNPFRKFRSELGLSQVAFAEEAGVSKHAILRLEQGMYDNPLPSVMEYVTSMSDLTTFTLLKDYEAYQKAVRAENPLIFGDMALKLLKCPVGTHPLTYLRKTAGENQTGINQTELAKRLCISQTVINNFESKPQTQHTVPLQLLRALNDNGYKRSSLVALTDKYQYFRSRLVSSSPVRLVIKEEDTNGADTISV